MVKSKRPRVITKCVADHYAGPGERIIEFSGPNGSGGLISLSETADGKLLLEVYRHDTNVVVRVGKAEGGAS